MIGEPQPKARRADAKTPPERSEGKPQPEARGANPKTPRERNEGANE
jgi:hypothetical protein